MLFFCPPPKKTQVVHQPQIRRVQAAAGSAALSSAKSCLSHFLRLSDSKEQLQLMIVVVPRSGNIIVILSFALAIHAAAQSNAVPDLPPGAESCTGDPISSPPHATRCIVEALSLFNFSIHPTSPAFPHQVNQSRSRRARYLGARNVEQGRVVGHGELLHLYLKLKYSWW